MPTYDINGFTYKSHKELNDIEINELTDRLAKSGVLDPEARKQEFQGREDLKANPGVMEAYKTYYKRVNGEDFKGTPDDAIDGYMEQMRYWNTNTGSLFKLAGSLKGNVFGEPERQAIATMWDTWDRTVPFYAQKEGKWQALGDFAQAAATDPTNWAGIFTGGSASAAGVASREAARAGIKQLIKSYAVQGAKAGAIQGGIYGAADSVLSQHVKTDVGLQGGVDQFQVLKDTALSAAGGAGLGGVLGVAQGALHSKLKTVVPGKEAGKPEAVAAPELDVNASLKAGEDFAKVYTSDALSGKERAAARLAARDSLTKSLIEAGVDTGNVGKKVSFADAQRKSGELLDRIGVEDFNDLVHVNEKLIDSFGTGKVDVKDLSTLTSVVLGMETRLLSEAQKAAKANSPDTVPLARAAMDASAFSSHISSEVARSTSFQKNRSRTVFQGNELTEAEFINKLVNSPDVVTARTYQDMIFEKTKKYGGMTIRGINEYWIHNVLGSLKTITANLFGGTSRLVIDPAEKTLGGLLKGDMNMAKGAVSEYVGTLYSINQALQYSWKSFKKSNPILDDRNFNDLKGQGHDIAVGNRDYNLDASLGSGEIWKGGDGILLNSLNMVGNFNRFVGKRTMVASDEALKHMAFRSKALGLAVEDNLDKGMSWKDAIKKAQWDADNALEAMLAASAKGKEVDDPLAALALKAAREKTFQDDMGTDVIGWAGNGLTKLRNSSPIFVQIIPFVRTPFRILEYVAARTPVLQTFTSEIRDKIAKGGRDAAEAEATLHMGSLITASALLAAIQYDPESSGTGNKGKDLVRRGAGIERNSVQISEDGTAIGINKLDPLARFYTMAAKIKDIYKFGEKEDQDAIAAALLYAFGKNFAEMGSMTGVKQMFDAFDGPAPTQRYVADKLGSFIPYFRALNDISGEDFAQANTFIERIYRGVPGLNKSLDRQRDPVFGTPFERAGTFLIPASPIPESKRSNDAVDKELIRLGASMLPPQPTVNNIDLRKIKHPETGRSAYDRYQELVGLVQNGEGKVLYESLRDLMNDPQYHENQTDPDTNVGYTETGGKLSHIKKRVDRYRGLALQQLGEEMPELAAELKLKKLEHKVSKTYQGQQRLADMLSNP